MLQKSNPFLNLFVTNSYNPAERRGEVGSSYAKLSGAAERLSSPKELSLKRLNIVARSTKDLETVTFNTSTGLVNNPRVADVANQIVVTARQSATNEIVTQQTVASEGVQVPPVDNVVYLEDYKAGKTTNVATFENNGEHPLSEKDILAHIKELHDRKAA